MDRGVEDGGVETTQDSSSSTSNSPLSFQGSTMPSFSTESTKKKGFAKKLIGKFQRQKFARAEFRTIEDVLELHPQYLPELARKLRSAASDPTESLRKFEKQNISVQVVCASGLRPADANGLSDPYCEIRMGHKKHRTRVIEKTLSPTWNETFVFGNDQVRASFNQQLPLLLFEVWDSDGPVVASDFLGQAEVDLVNFDAEEDSEGVKLTLPLYAIKGGKKYIRDLGSITVSIWTSKVDENPAVLHRQSSMVSSSLVVPPNVGKSLPLTTHADGNTLYEEPCMAYALMMVWEVRHLVVDSQSNSANAVALPKSLTHPLDSRPPSLKLPSSKSSAFAASIRETLSINPSTLGKKFKTSNSQPVEVEDDFDDDDLDGLWGTGTSNQQVQEKEEGTGGDMDGDLDEVDDYTSIGEEIDKGSEGRSSQHLLYYRIRLNDNSLLKGKLAQFSSGRATWTEPQVFGMPLPVSMHKKVKLSVYHTRKRTKVGRLVGRVWIRPFDVLDQVTAMKKAEGIPDGQWHQMTTESGDPSGEVRFAVSFVDVDIRRAMYNCPLLADLPDDFALEDEAKPVPPKDQPNRFLTAVHAAKLSTDLMATAKRVAHQHNLPTHYEEPPRDESADKENTANATGAATRDLLTGGSAKSLVSCRSDTSEGSTTSGTIKFTPGNSWDMDKQPSSNAPNMLAKSTSPKPTTIMSRAARRLVSIRNARSGDKRLFDGSLMDKLRNFRASMHVKEDENKVQLLGTFRMVLQNVELLTPPTDGKLFCVFKCGPHWGMTKTVNSKEAEWNWEVKLPLYEPSTMLILCCFSQQSTTLLKKKASGATAQLIGKLRIRLSTLKSGVELSLKLPMLCDRSKDKIIKTANANVKLQVEYNDTVALMKRYTKPLVMERMYYLDVVDQVPILNLQCNFFAMEWLELQTKPPIPRHISKHVAGQERYNFHMSRLKVNGFRIKMVLAKLAPVKKYIKHIKSWDNPWESGAVVAGIALTFFFPSSGIPLALFGVLGLVIWKYINMKEPVLDMEEDPEAAEDDDAPEKSGNPYAQLKRKYTNIIRIVLKIQVFLDELATKLEMLQGMFAWRDPVATGLFAVLLFIAAMAILIVGLPFIMSFVAFWILRPPILRTPTPPFPFNIYARLPSKADRIA